MNGMKGLKKKRRIQVILVAFVALFGSAALIGYAMRDGINYFRPPSDVVAEPPSERETFRIGGLVTDGSVKRQPNGLTVRFDVTDLQKTVSVEYTGILPDLFREGQGIVAHGKLRNDGVFVADEVLAKHDEKYMPPEVAASLKEAHNKGVGAATAKEATP